MLRASFMRALVLVLLALAACKSSGSTHGPSDAGNVIIPDAGSPPVCTVGCHEVPDAGADAGYQAQPLTITAVVPHRGPVNGGTSVQLTGTGFMKDFTERASEAPKLSTLLVGGNPALDLTVISDTVAEFTSPPGLAGAADVTLTNPNGTATCRGCFTYFAPVLLQSISPTVGALAGGTPVTLTGKGFSADTTVLFGDKAAAPVTFDATAGTLTAVTPPGELVGSVDVRVFNTIGTSALRQGFRYAGPPQLLSASPAGGPTSGGTVINLTGRGLADLTSCNIGAGAATLLVQDDASAQLIAPPAPEGAYDITCTGAFGSSTLKSAFSYFDPSNGATRLIGLGPTHGPSAGGNTVTLYGGGLSSVASVRFGGQPAAIVSASGNALVVTAPAGPARTSVDVALDTGATLTGGYHYNLALQAVRPAHGPTSGGTALQFDGDGFSSDVLLTIGGVSATGISATSPQLLAATSPAGAGGAALVRVQSPTDPEDFAELAHGFTYDATLTVGAVVPPSGAVAGGTYVTLYGSGFAEGMVVHFGAHRAKDLTVVDSHTATLHTPAGTVGSVDVSAALGTATATTADAYSYIDPTNAGGGATGGPLDGTVNVTVLDDTYTQFGQPVSGAFVILGNDSSTPFQGTTDAHGQITFSDPSLLKAQTVSVTKAGYETVTIVGQASQNLTVYIGQNDGTGGSAGSSGGGISPVAIRGKVRGFKLPRPLQSYEHEEARVAVAPHSVYGAPPLGAPDRAGTGERSVLNADGQTYSRIVYPGLYAVYAVYGIVDDRTNLFTPVLMGIARDIRANSANPPENADIVLDMHLDYSAPISVVNPLVAPGSTLPAVNNVYAFLDLGGEGVVPLGSVSSYTPDLVFPGLPEVDGANLVFVNESDVNGTPVSYFFRRQPGDPRTGIELGPMLGLIDVTTPSQTDPGFAGTIAWSVGSGPPPDMTQLQILKLTPLGAVSLWNVILPGDATSVSLPQTAIQSLLDREPPGESLQVLIITDREPRFDYNHWSYGDLGYLSWTSFSFDIAMMQLPGAPDGGGP